MFVLPRCAMQLPSNLNIFRHAASSLATHRAVVEDRNDVRVRLASPEDYHHVLAINSDIYWGRDYLPWRYHKLLTSPLYEAVVCEQKGGIVGFAAARIVDEGTTLVLTSGRVSERAQGQGHAKVMLDYLHDLFKDEKRLLREAITTKGENKSLKRQSFQEEYTHVMQRTIHSFYFDVRHVKIPTAMDHTLFDNPASSDRQKQLLRAAILSPASHHLFPQQRIIANWYPYRLLQGNVANITEENCVVTSHTCNHNNDLVAESAENCKLAASHIQVSHKKILQRQNRYTKTKDVCKTASSQDRRVTRAKSIPTNHNRRLVRTLGPSSSTANYNRPEIQDSVLSNHNRREIQVSAVSNHNRREIHDSVLSNHNRREIQDSAVSNHNRREIQHSVMSNHNRREIHDSVVSHVSIGSFFPCTLGLAYNVDMYGDLDDEAAVSEHLSQHLQRMQHLTGANVHLLLFTDTCAPGQVLDRCLGQFGVCRRHWPQNSVHLFERPRHELH